MPGKLHDNLQLFRKLTFTKVIHIFWVYLTYWMSKFIGKPLFSPLPFSVGIEPTTACNLGCPECPSGLKSFTRPTGSIKEITYKKIIDQIKKTTSYLTFYFQGEPYIHPEFLNMISYATKSGIYTSTSTNAHFLTPKKAEQTIKSGLDRIIISIDGTTQEVYESYRKNGTLQDVIKGTKHLVEAKEKVKSKTPYIVFQFLVVSTNEHQIQGAKKLAKTLGVNSIVFKTAQFYDYKNGNPLMPKNLNYSRYFKKKDGTFALKNKLDNSCWKLWSSCVFTWNGNVIPCCFDKDAQFVMGNIQTHSFKDIHASKKYMKFRNSLFTNRASIDICKNCSEGSQIWNTA